jgi:hypothetical protein
MAVEETLDLCQHLASELNLHPDGVVCNMVSPMLRSGDSGLDLMPEDNEVGVFLRNRHRTEMRHFKKLQASLEVPFHLVERIGRHETDLEFLFGLCRQIQKTTLADA